MVLTVNSPSDSDSVVIELETTNSEASSNSKSESTIESKWRLLTRGKSVANQRRGSKSRPISMLDIARERLEYALNHWEKEKLLIKMNWKLLLLCLFFQYVHSVATNIAYYLHTQREPLYDLGFAVMPALSREFQIVSEIMFFMLFGSTIVFLVSPFWGRTAANKQLFSMVMLMRFLSVCMAAQFLRCVCFLLTSLPGPNYHCRPGSPDYAPPQTMYDMFFRLDAFFGCGDLVFSSHTTFVVLCALTYTKYGDNIWRKRAIWFSVLIFGFLVVSARKHYSLDIFVAWYTVPLLWIAHDKYYPDRIPQELIDDDDDSATTKKESV